MRDMHEAARAGIVAGATTPNSGSNRVIEPTWQVFLSMSQNAYNNV